MLAGQLEKYEENPEIDMSNRFELRIKFLSRNKTSTVVMIDVLMDNIADKGSKNKLQTRFTGTSSHMFQSWQENVAL